MTKGSQKMSQMKWIELIRVRASAAALQEAMPLLQKQVKDIERSTSGVETFFMQHALYHGDLAVVLVWLNKVGTQKTREGLMVAARLQDLGPVDHAVWIPVEKGV
jgi:cell division inhibitor SulA